MKEQQKEYILLKALMDHLNYSVIFLDIDGIILFINATGCWDFNKPRDFIVGKNIKIFFPDNQFDKFEKNIKQAIQQKENIITDDLVKFVEHEKWIESSFIPIYNKDASVYGAQWIYRDISYRKKEEEDLRLKNDELSIAIRDLEKRQNESIENEKMAALGGLVAGVAHEINTPLGIGVTAVSHLRIKTEQIDNDYKTGKMKKSSLEKYLSMAMESTEIVLSNLRRASKLVSGFKQIAVDQSIEERRKFDLKEYMDEILLSLKPKFKGTNYKINFECDQGMVIDNYPGAFSQVITNLIMNSLIHGFDGLDQGVIDMFVTNWAGRISISYRDDGKGMSKEIVNKIFDPFFTTKRGHGGTGLGMHLVYNLITKNLGGNINCQSIEGDGTTFIIDLPEKFNPDDNAEENNE